MRAGGSRSRSQILEKRAADGREGSRFIGWQLVRWQQAAPSDLGNVLSGASATWLVDSGTEIDLHARVIRGSRLLATSRRAADKRRPSNAGRRRTYHGLQNLRTRGMNPALLPIDSARVTSWLSKVHVQKQDGWIFEELGNDFLGSVPFDYVSANQHIVPVESPDR